MTTTNYTPEQIERAKAKYHQWLQYKCIYDYEYKVIGRGEAERRCEFHNNLVDEIRKGNTQLEREWKLSFLRDEVEADWKREATKAKLAANKAASADVLAAIKSAGKKLGDYYKWLNTQGNAYRSEFFSKKYTVKSVNAYLSI